jgi:calcium-binding protein CML
MLGTSRTFLQGKISDVDIQRLAIETGEHFTIDEVTEMVEAADENGT